MARAMRQVKAIEKTPQGDIVTLDCGHRMWFAGGFVRTDYAECLIGPCYKPEKAMGNDHW